MGMTGSPRCPRCANEIPSWNGGRCPRCDREEDERKRRGRPPSRRGPQHSGPAKRKELGSTRSRAVDLIDGYAPLLTLIYSRNESFSNILRKHGVYDKAVMEDWDCILGFFSAVTALLERHAPLTLPPFAMMLLVAKHLPVRDTLCPRSTPGRGTPERDAVIRQAEQYLRTDRGRAAFEKIVVEAARHCLRSQS